jgi:threonine dehydrogenase-like Zn-dependent dehydrogenase
MRSRAAILYEYRGPWSVEEFELDPDISLLATMYESGQLLLDEMITKRYGLDEINEAYADLAAGQLIRGVIDFGLD